jgi:hypothetical protein
MVLRPTFDTSDRTGLEIFESVHTMFAAKIGIIAGNSGIFAENSGMDTSIAILDTNGCTVRRQGMGCSRLLNGGMVILLIYAKNILWL